MSATAEETIKQVLSPEEPSIDRKIEETAEKVTEKDDNGEFEEPDGISVGIETEYYILDGDNNTVEEDIRDQIVGKGTEYENLDNVDHELGASMVEIATEPVELNAGSSLDELAEELSRVENNLLNRIDNVSEEEDKELKLVRHGFNTAARLDDIQRTEEPKYQGVPAEYDKMRRKANPDGFRPELDIERSVEEFGKFDSIDPRNEDIPAASCATQLNMQADGIDDAIEKANIGYAIAPYITALSGNSRFVDGKDIGFNDSRTELWERAYDIGNFEKDDLDIGRLDEYFESLEDITGRMLEQPRIVTDSSNEGITDDFAEKVREIPFDVAQGMYWKDSRIKAVDEEEIRDDVLVEFRQNSTQPSIAEDIAVHAFYIGRVLYEQEVVDGEYPEDLPDIEKVNKNRYNAMRHGLEEELYDWNGEKREASEVIEEELDKARKGLEKANIDDPGYINLLEEERLEKGKTPSDRVAEEYYTNLIEKIEEDYQGIEAIDSAEQLHEEINYDKIDEEVKRPAAVEATNQVSKAGIKR